ncbi:MAG TPA: ATP-binding cassette domain-containing protein [Candidatus Binatia bacterium]|nr:ATP-binding cassette domain-containing protein [Candidatus Binatia bacterium]
MPPLVHATALTRAFGSSTAVEGLDLAVDRGEVFGLLGPNGAGKTTTIRMLATLLRPTSGTARVCGFDVTQHADAVRRRIGYVMQQTFQSGRYLLTGREAVEIEAALYHVPPRAVRGRAAEVLDVVGLTQHADRLVMTYSGGMKKRLELACGLLHRPEVLFLDEPSLGLDVQSRHAMWDHVRALRDGGVTVLVATNYLDEADRICDRLTIIDHGRAVTTGAPDALKRAVGGDVLLVSTAERERLMQIVRAAPWAIRVAAPDAVVHVYVQDASVALPALMRLALDAGIALERLSYTQPTLDDVFLLHTGRELREAA